MRDGDGRTIAALNVTVHAAETPVEVLTGEYLPFGLVPTWRCRVASKEKKFSRSAASWVWRSAQNSRRVCYSGPSPSSWATAFWTMSASSRSGCAITSRNPTGPP